MHTWEARSSARTRCGLYGGYSRRRLPLGGEGAAEPGAELDDGGTLLGADVDVRQRAEPSDLAFARSGEDARHALEAAGARRRRELGAEQVFADVLVEEEDVGGAALGDGLQLEVERAKRDTFTRTATATKIWCARVVKFEARMLHETTSKGVPPRMNSLHCDSGM